jgi:hypothetical protein
MFYSSFASVSKKYTGYRWRKFSIHFLKGRWPTQLTSVVR